MSATPSPSEPFRVVQAREALKTCEENGLYAGHIYNQARRVIAAADPASLVGRMFSLVEILNRAEQAIEDFYGDELALMTPERAAQFEAIFPDKPPYFEIAPIANKIKAMADAWQVQIDGDKS